MELSQKSPGVNSQHHDLRGEDLQGLVSAKGCAEPSTSSTSLGIPREGDYDVPILLVKELRHTRRYKLPKKDTMGLSLGVALGSSPSKVFLW